jgi:hypothetical protein
MGLTGEWDKIEEIHHFNNFHNSNPFPVLLPFFIGGREGQVFQIQIFYNTLSIVDGKNIKELPFNYNVDSFDLRIHASQNEYWIKYT